MTQRNENTRFVAFIGFGVLVFTLLIYRLIQLQVVEGVEYRAKSEDNRIRFVEMLAPRGVIRDRKGHLLVSNRPSYTCYGSPRDLYQDSMAVEHLGFALAGDPAEIRDKALKPFRNSFRPQRLRRDLPYPLLARFEEMRDQIPGAYLEIEPKRFYPGGIAPHVIGYVAEVSDDELAKFPGLQSGDLVGKRGLERLYDKELRGVKGSRLSVVDVHGQEVESAAELGRIEPVPGNELWTTLDRDVQLLAESLLVDKIGSIVAIDVRTGGVVVMASSPTYNPDVFAGSISSQRLESAARRSRKADAQSFRANDVSAGFDDQTGDACGRLAQRSDYDLVGRFVSGQFHLRQSHLQVLEKRWPRPH